MLTTLEEIGCAQGAHRANIPWGHVGNCVVRIPHPGALQGVCFRAHECTQARMMGPLGSTSPSPSSHRSALRRPRPTCMRCCVLHAPSAYKRRAVGTWRGLWNEGCICCMP
uniref:Uncharacterized protein n=1 Tax=Eutreptiella gymnastica TaxID=73025 RepID=A0A7S1J9R6_9EUGL